MVYFFLGIIFLVIIFLLIFVNRKILQLRKGKNKNVAPAEILNESTKSKFKDIFVNASEEYISSLGNGYILNYLANRSIKRGFAIISDKRVYFRGSCYTGTGSHLVKSDEQRTVDIKDITGSGFVYRRYLGTLLALVTAFVTLVGGVAGSGYGISETVNGLARANNRKQNAQVQLKDYESFDHTKAKKEIENLKAEIEELKKLQESTYNDTSEEASEEVTGTPEEITINKAIARQVYNVFCEDKGYNLYQTASRARDYLISERVYEEDIPGIMALSDYSRIERAAQSYDESFWMNYTVNVINDQRKYSGDDSILINTLLSNGYFSLMGFTDYTWYYELRKAMLAEHIESNLQDYPDINYYNQTHTAILARILYYEIEDNWTFNPDIFMPYNFTADYTRAVEWMNKWISGDGNLSLSAANPSSVEKYTQELLDTLHLNYSGNLSELNYYDLLNLYKVAKEEEMEVIAELNIDIDNIPSEINKREGQIKEVEETIERYNNDLIKKSIENTIADEQSEVNRNFVYTAGLGGTAALLLTFAISVMLVIFDYLKKRKTFFEIQYAGGRIAFNVSYYALAEIEDFQKMLRRAKDLAESAVTEPTRSLAKSFQEQSNQTVDKADELRKYAKLLEDGLISQEEYDAMKKKVLGL